MYANWLTLLGVNLRSIFTSGQVGSKKRKNSHSNIVIMVLIYALFGALFAFYCGMMTYLYVYIGMTDVVMPMMMTVSSIFVLFTTILKANGFLFASKDDDLLMSMPIRISQMIIGRIATLYIFEMLQTFVMMAPSIVIIAIMVPVSAGFIFEAALSILFVPLIPLAIASLIAIVITYISCRFKHKNAISIVLGMAALIAVMYFSMSARHLNEQVLADLSNTILNVFANIYFPAKMYIAGLAGNVAAYIGYLVISFAVIAGVTALLTWQYKRIATFMTTEKSKSNYKVTSLKTSGCLYALYKKEFKFYTSVSVYVMNTAFSFVLMIIAGIAVFFIKDIDSMLNIPGIDAYIFLFLPMVPSFFMAISSTTFPSISLEGKNLWFVAHLPVSAEQVYAAKILMNLTISIPSSVITSILFIIRFKPDFLTGTLTILLPIAYGIFSAVFGLLLNLKFPNFQWVNATTVVKQGIPAMVCSLGGMLLVIIPAILIFTFSSAAPIIYSVLVLVLLIVSLFMLKSISKISLITLSE